MAKKIDVQVLNTMIMGVIKDTFEQLCHAAFSADPVAVEKDIIEYDGRMRLTPMEKFNAPAHVAVINYYLPLQRFETNDPAGTFILYVKEDVIEKLFKAFGRRANEAEDEVACLEVVGEMGHILAGNIKNALTAMGFVELTLAASFTYKNAVPEGVPFDYRLFKKQEISFSFWKQKCIVVEMCLGDIPVKGQ